jgi:hypothetical protein
VDVRVPGQARAGVGGHRVGAEAADAGAAGASTRGPFWPQPASARATIHPAPNATRRRWRRA